MQRIFGRPLLIVLVIFGLSTVAAQRITTTGWPIAGMPTPEQQEADSLSRAHAAALEAWLEQNPGVSVEQIEFNIWDQQALLTAVAGGTAPTYFPGNTLGGWSPPAIRSAFLQGLAADITDLYYQYGLDQKMTPPVPELFRQYWEVNGRFYGIPIEVLPTNGVLYRKDLIRELGLEEPTPDWTWDDFRELARALTTEHRRGTVLEPWMIFQELISHGWDTMTTVPAPETSWNWRYAYSSAIDWWEPTLLAWRQAIHEEGSVILQERGAGGEETLSMFFRGDVAMVITHSNMYTRSPSDPNSASALADSLGMPVYEAVGWVPYPRGRLDTLSNSTPLMVLVSFNPDLPPRTLEAAVGLYDYFYFGEGYIALRQAIWEARQDLRYVYNNPLPINGMETIPGVPGGVADAWGEEFIANVRAGVDAPLRPTTALYLPAEADVGQSTTAFNDAFDRIMYSSGPVDIRAEFANAERIINQQAASFRSSTPDEVFLAGVREYYAAVEQYYREHSPVFYSQVYRPWYEEHVAPVLDQ